MQNIKIPEWGLNLTVIHGKLWLIVGMAEAFGTAATYIGWTIAESAEEAIGLVPTVDRQSLSTIEAIDVGSSLEIAVMMGKVANIVDRADKKN